MHTNKLNNTKLRAVGALCVKEICKNCSSSLTGEVLIARNRMTMINSTSDVVDDFMYRILQPLGAS